MSKVIATILAAALCVLLLTGAPAPTYRAAAEAIQNPYAQAIVPQEGARRDTLDEAGQQLYDLVKSSLFTMEREVEVKRLAYGEDDLWNVVSSIMYDSPEIFWVDWANWQVRSDNDGFVLAPTYIIEDTSLASMRAELDGAVAAFTSALSTAGLANGSDYDKVLFLHDYLVANVSYDDEYMSYPEGERMNLHTTYGALVERVAVCDGYAHTVNLLLREVGVDSEYVEGSTLDSLPDEGHAWNLVKVDDRWYHLDVTWDDLDAEQDEERPIPGVVSHVYFLLSDSEMGADHTAEPFGELPQSPAGYDYFGKLGLSGEDIEDIKDALAVHAFQGIENDRYLVEFQITDPAGYADVINSEFALGDTLVEINELLEDAGYSRRVDEYTYQLVPNENRGTFSFILFEEDDE